MQHTTISSITKGERGRDIQGRSCTWNDLLLLVIKMGQINAFIFSILMIAAYVNNIICNAIVFLCFLWTSFSSWWDYTSYQDYHAYSFFFFPLPSASLISDKHKINHKLRNSFSFLTTSARSLVMNITDSQQQTLLSKLCCKRRLSDHNPLYIRGINQLYCGSLGTCQWIPRKKRNKTYSEKKEKEKEGEKV